MIPKSVSVSSRILALAAVLTWPVWGWAGEPKETRWCFNESTNDVYPCIDWPAAGIWRGPKEIILRQWQDKQTCYQQMREAMKETFGKGVLVIYHDPVDGVAKEYRISMEEGQYRRIRQTMQKCVEGGK